MSRTIPLTQGKATVISDEDADLVGQGWYCLSQEYEGQTYDYAVRNIVTDEKTTLVLLHRVLLERMLGHPPIGVDMIEHIDGNTLNNQRGNLRYCTRNQKFQRIGVQRNNTSGYKGVHFNKTAKLWQATIGKHNHYLGCYPSREDAARAYDQAALELYGEHAKLNFPHEKERANASH